MFDAQLAAFALVALALTITPGADTMLVLRNSLRGGRSDGMGTMIGICTGLFVHAVFSALGLSVILAESAQAFQAVKIAGAIYLVWLGLQSLFRASRRGRGELVGPTKKQPPRLRRSLMEGLLTNILNPKVAIFYLAFLPQFISPGDPVLAKSLLMALIHYLMGIVWLSGIILLVARSRQWINRGAIRRWLDGVSGAVLVALGIRLALEKR